MDYSLRLNKGEIEVINEIIEESNLASFVQFQFINEREQKIIIESLEIAEKIDSIVKDKLVYKGFDKDYKPTDFGLSCENLIDKFYKILK